MTAIADAELQRLFAVAINEQQLTQGIVNTAAQAFIEALNERLTGKIIGHYYGQDKDYQWRQGCTCRLCTAETDRIGAQQQAAYRQSKERT